MRVIILASYRWNYSRILEDDITQLRVRTRRKKENLLIIHGNNDISDKVIYDVCQELSIDQIMYPANKTLGGHGWYRRNQIMLQEHDIDLVMVYDLSIVPDTPEYDMKIRAERRRVPVRAIDYDFISKRDTHHIDSDPVGGHL